MPRGSKAKYTDKQKRQAEHIEEGYEDKGVSENEAKRRAWATVNKETGGGEKMGGSGRKKSASAKAASRKSVGKSAAKTRKTGHR
jgi:plasmid stabilization system protein ParE